MGPAFYNSAICGIGINEMEVTKSGELSYFGATVTPIHSREKEYTMNNDVVDTLISPEGRLEVLSKAEVAKLLDTSQGGLYQLFRKCALAVLNSGSDIDDGKE